MPRLVFVVNDAPFFLSHRLPLAVGAREAGYDVHVLTPDHPRAAEIAAAGLSFHPVPLLRGGASLRSEIQSIRALTRLYRGLRPDIVHHVTHKPIIYGSLVARFVGVPAVVNAISGLGFAFAAEGWKAEVRRRLILAGYRVAFGHTRCWGIFQNRDDAALFERGRIIEAGTYTLVTGSGVDLGEFIASPEPEGTPVVVLAARMLWDKGVGDFVEAARLLKSRGVALRAVLVGEPDPRNPRSVSRDQLEQWVRDGVVEWWGRREDMAAVMASAHVVCLPSSYREGVPKVLLEAAASGRPVVTTDVPGCRDVVRSEWNGIVVPPRDEIALAGAIQRLVGDSELRKRMGTRNRSMAEAEFGVERVVAATLEVYRELLAGPPNAPMPREQCP